MTRWAAFAGITLAVLGLLLLLARASQSVVTDSERLRTREELRWLDRLADGAGHLDVRRGATSTPTPPVESTPKPASDPSKLALFVNVAVSHGFFALLLLGGVWVTGVPASALGITSDPVSTGWLAVVVGVALGVALSLANTVGGGVARRFRTEPSEMLREMLAPETFYGWVVLLVGVLPIIATFEELLFRAALIGAFAVCFNLSPWLLAVLSSDAFAAGHGAQGILGIVVTGVLGFVLAAAFVLTNSLVVVVVAHYVVNASEFIVTEKLNWKPFGE